MVAEERERGGFKTRVVVRDDVATSKPLIWREGDAKSLFFLPELLSGDVCLSEGKKWMYMAHKLEFL